MSEVRYSRSGRAYGIGAHQTPAAAHWPYPVLWSLRHDVSADKQSHTVSKIKLRTAGSAPQFPWYFAGGRGARSAGR
jgi:hypothetical protein